MGKLIGLYFDLMSKFKVKLQIVNNQNLFGGRRLELVNKRGMIVDYLHF